MRHRGLYLWQTVILAVSIIFGLVLPVHYVLPELIGPWYVPIVVLVTVLYLIDFYFEFQFAKGRGPSYLKKYTRDWLVIDALSIIPFALFVGWTPVAFLQFAKFIHVGFRINENIRQSPRFASVLRLTHFAYILLTVIHWVTCMRIEIHPIAGIDATSQYLRSLHWATTTLANAGLADAPPTANSDLIFSVCMMLIGLVMYGYLIGNIASILNKIDPARVHHEETLEKVHAFIRYRNLPIELERRINDYYSYVWEQRLGYDETSVLTALPPGLKTEVSLYLKREVLERVNIFRDASEEFIREISIFLHAQIVMPGDYVFKIGDSARSMYFISKGAVEVLSADGVTLTNLSEGDFFGEMALIHKRKRNASVRAVQHTDLYVLDVASFERILNYLLVDQQ